jgi:transcriptional regulator with PAS, ATPase and Fis domain
MRKEKVEQEDVEYINKNIKSAIDQYKGLIQEEKIERMYQDLPELSKNIAKNIPHQELTWKQAETVFEKEYIKHHLKKSKNIKELASKIGLRPETVSRKIGKLRLR